MNFTHRTVSFLVVSVVLIALSMTTLHAQAMTPSKIESVGVQPSGGWLFEAGFNWEKGRTLATGTPDLEYDNIRLHPLSITYGYNDWIQFGAGLGYSANTADNSANFPDEGGFEGITLSTKMKWNKNIATTVELGAGGADDVYPYSNNSFNLGLNIPMKMSLGPGTLNGELGYTFQTGDAAFPSTTVDRAGYLNYGIGYVYEVNRTFGLSGEIRGNGATVDDSGSRSAESMLSLVLGTPIRMSKSSHLKPALTVGLSDGSPSFALGIDYGLEFGNQQRYKEGTMGRTPTGQQGLGQAPSSKKKKGQDPLVMPKNKKQKGGQSKKQAGPLATNQQPMKPASGSSQKQQTGPTYNPEQAAKYAQKGRRAFENGNYQKAIQAYTKAAKNDPTNVEYQSNLGSLYYRQGKYEMARKHYQKAVQIDPRDYFSHLYLGASHYQLGNTQKAREHFNRVLEIQPGNKQAKKWLDRIKQKQ